MYVCMYVCMYVWCMVILHCICASEMPLLSLCVSAIGGATNILLSRKHFAMSLNMQSPKLNVRAYYGLIMACKAFSELSAKQKSSNRFVDSIFIVVFIYIYVLTTIEE